MKTADLAQAIAQAKRFIALAETVTVYKTYSGGELPELCNPGRAAASAKRASLDLSQALARIRR